MTTEGIAATETGTQTDDERIFCYRHPDRETWLRCGRCDRPICTGCAMQGPVGSRCRQCGKPAFDPLTSLTAAQAATAAAVATGLGIVTGLIGAQFGLFSIVVGFIAGGFIAAAVVRFIGYKRGPLMLTVLMTGIIVGVLIGHAISYAWSFSQMLAEVPVADQLLAPLVIQTLFYGLITAGATCFGAYRRMHG